MGSVERVGWEGRTSRRWRLQMQLALDNRRRFCNLVCLVLLFIHKGTSQVLVQFVPVVGFFKIYFFFFFIFTQKSSLRSSRFRFLSDLRSRHFPLAPSLSPAKRKRKRLLCRLSKIMSRSTSLNGLLSKPLHSHTEVVYPNQTSIFRTLEARGNISYRSSFKQAVYA